MSSRSTLPGVWWNKLAWRHRSSSQYGTGLHGHTLDARPTCSQMLRAFSKSPVGGPWTWKVTEVLLSSSFLRLLRLSILQLLVWPFLPDGQGSLVLYINHGAVTFSCFTKREVRETIVFNMNYLLWLILHLTNFLSLWQVHINFAKIYDAHLKKRPM